MTRDEFIAKYKPPPEHEVRECHCGAGDCPGWKLVDPEWERQYAEAMERLPEILCEAARRAGERMGREVNDRFWRAFLDGR